MSYKTTDGSIPQHEPADPRRCHARDSALKPYPKASTTGSGGHRIRPQTGWRRATPHPASTASRRCGVTSTLEPPPGGRLMTGQASIASGMMLCMRDAVPPALPPPPIVRMPRSDASYRVGLLQTPVSLGGRRGSHGYGLVTT